MTKGLFLSFEGIDGSGKSTQSKLLADALCQSGRTVTLTREPGGSPGAEEIRSLLVQGDPARWSPETEMLLFYAARRDHLERTIRPALKSGHVVISDRFADSTRVYQGATRGDLRPLVDDLHRLVIGQEPDITIVVDMDPETALERGLARNSGEDRFEDFGLDFQKALRSGFLKLAEEFPQRVKIVSGMQTPEAVHQSIMDALIGII